MSPGLYNDDDLHKGSPYNFRKNGKYVTAYKDAASL